MEVNTAVMPIKAALVQQLRNRGPTSCPIEGVADRPSDALLQYFEGEEKKVLPPVRLELTAFRL